MYVDLTDDEAKAEAPAQFEQVMKKLRQSAARRGHPVPGPEIVQWTFKWSQAVRGVMNTLEFFASLKNPQPKPEIPVVPPAEDLSIFLVGKLGKSSVPLPVEGIPLTISRWYEEGAKKSSLAISAKQSTQRIS